MNIDEDHEYCILTYMENNDDDDWLIEVTLWYSHHSYHSIVWVRSVHRMYIYVDMYRQFQHDLYRMRLETARNYVGVLQKSMSPISISQADPVKLHVEVGQTLYTATCVEMCWLLSQYYGNHLAV